MSGNIYDGRVARTVCSRAQLHRQGSAAVEFALCLPVIVLLMLGLWEIGRIVQVSNVMRHGAREAARRILRTCWESYLESVVR